MNIGIIIQARMNSARTPGKVLRSINGIPLIDYLVSRLRSKHFGQICIATSNQPTDDLIEEFCIKNQIYCFRGPLDDVAKRMLNAANYFEIKAFVRLNGDSPLLDPEIVEKAIQIYCDGNYDLVTNAFPRSYPIGQSVEVIKTRTFKKVYSKMSLPDEFEHVTHYYYNHKNEFKIKNFKNNRNLSDYRMVVDTPEDLKTIERIICRMTKPFSEYNLDELIELYPSA